MATRTADVLDSKKVDDAIDRMIEMFAEEELTVAECIKAVRAVDASLKSTHPDVYRILAG